MTPGAWTPPPTCELTTSDRRVVRFCCYGPPDGAPVVSLPGTPGTRWERPDVISAIEQGGLRMVVPDRPGYGGSTRQPGRTVADVAGDVQLIAQAQGWQRFAVTGFSGGGPHALACAALLAGQVTCCAVLATPAPPDAPGVGFFADRGAGQAEDFRLALRGEQALRPYLRARTGDAMGRMQADSSAAADPGRMTRIRAMYLGGLDGWVDDDIALAHSWGFDPASIGVPVGIWHGAQDSRIPRAHTDWLLAHIPAAHGHEHPDGHDPSDRTYRELLGWIVATGGDAAGRDRSE